MPAFTLRSFLKHTPPEDLRAHFETVSPDIASAVDWSLGLQALADSVVEAIEALEMGRRDALEALFQKAAQLATEEGRRALRSVVATDADRLAVFDAMEDARSCALWLARTDEHAFENALAAHLADHHQHGRSWSAFHVSTDSGIALRRDDDARAAFADGARAALTLPGGSIGRMIIELVDRVMEDPADGRVKTWVQATVYAEGAPESALRFKAADDMERYTDRPVIAAVALYDPADQVIEVVAKGGRNVQAALAHAFARSALAGAGDVERLPQRNIAMHRFASRPGFPLRAEDRVTRVHVDRLALTAPAADGGFVLLERKSPNGSAGDVYDAAAEWFSRHNPVGRRGWKVRSARLRVAFAPEREGARAKVVLVELTHPNRSNLRDQTEAHRLIAHTLMERWGLYESQS